MCTLLFTLLGWCILPLLHFVYNGVAVADSYTWQMDTCIRVTRPLVKIQSIDSVPHAGIADKKISKMRRKFRIILTCGGVRCTVSNSFPGLLAIRSCCICAHSNQECIQLTFRYLCWQLLWLQALSPRQDVYAAHQKFPRMEA